MARAMKPPFATLVVAALLLVTGVSWANAQPPPSFPFGPISGTGEGQWLGGDVGAMTPLDAQLSFWGFADTYVGEPGATRRNRDRFVGNSISIFNRADSTSQYFCRGTPDRPRAFFEDWAPAELRTRLACAKPFVSGGKLFVILNRVQVHNNSLGFMPVSTVIARVNNLSQPPPNWQVDYLDLCEVGYPTLGAEAFASGPDLIVYGVTGGDPRASNTRTAVISIKLDVLATAAPRSKLAPHVVYLSADSTWKPGFPGNPDFKADLHPDYWDVDIPSTSGFSVRYHKDLGAWQAVYVDNKAEDKWVTKVFVKLSKKGPFGPWDAPRKIFDFPERIASHPLYRRDGWCYAVGEKAEFASDPRTRIKFTYCNTRDDLGALETDLDYYRVKPVEVANPFASSLDTGAGRP
jgi:hypothetical protein